MHYRPAGPTGGSGSARDVSSPYALHPPPFHRRAYGSVDTMYPSTLHPGRQIQSHHLQQQQQPQQPQQAHPVKLLQSCDSCRRRKIRCSGERPCCSSCMRYQETCHYSPLATPRRRTGKRSRTSADDGHPGDDHLADARSTGSHPGEERLHAEHPPPLALPAPAADDYAARADVPAAAGAAPEAAGSWRDEAAAMRGEMAAMARRFDVLGTKLDALIGAIGKRRRLNSSEELSDDESSDESTSRSLESTRHALRVGDEFAGLVDHTSRFGVDLTNIGIINNLMTDLDQTRTAGREGPPEGHAAHDAPPAAPSAEVQSRRAAALQRLGSRELRDHLLDTFYGSADANVVSLIPRLIFDRLRRDKSVPGVMLHVMLACACAFSAHEAVQAVGPREARDHFIERAYSSLFACLEYDSVEHCVALVLFATVSSQAGLHRAWIMQSLGLQMALRMRLSTLDAPLTVLAFQGDTELAREWKRRVFWQLYAGDILSSTLGDLAPCLQPCQVRCRLPRTQSEADGGEVAALGPAVVLVDDQPTIELQVDLLGIMSDISTFQSVLVPEEGPFPDAFYDAHARLAQWQQRLPHGPALVAGARAQVADEARARPGLVSLGLLFHYTRILLYMVKDTWLPTQRALGDREQAMLAHARALAHESAQMVHRLVPLVRAMQLAAVSSFVPCIVLQACVASIHACAPDGSDPRCTAAAISDIQNGLEFLDHVAPRWGFARMLTASLRTIVADCGIGGRCLGNGGDGPPRDATPGSERSADGEQPQSAESAGPCRRGPDSAAHQQQ